MKMHNVPLWLTKYWKLHQMVHLINAHLAILPFYTGGRLSESCVFVFCYFYFSTGVL